MQLIYPILAPQIQLAINLQVAGQLHNNELVLELMLKIEVCHATQQLQVCRSGFESPTNKILAFDFRIVTFNKILAFAILVGAFRLMNQKLVFLHIFHLFYRKFEILN